MCTLPLSIGVPLTVRTLTLLKWEDKHGCQKRFRLITKVSSRWTDFGRLFGQEEDELEGLGVQYHYKAKQCWCKVVSQWLDNGGTAEYPATWGGFISVLEDVELWEVARELEVVLRSAIVHTPAEPPAELLPEPSAQPTSEPTSKPPAKSPEFFTSKTLLSWFSPPHTHLSLAPPSRRYFSLMPSLTHPILQNEFPSPQQLLLRLMSSHFTPTSVSEQQPSSFHSSPTPPPSP